MNSLLQYLGDGDLIKLQLQQHTGTEQMQFKSGGGNVARHVKTGGLEFDGYRRIRGFGSIKCVLVRGSMAFSVFGW
jgi:hypothetical protein